MAVVWKKLGYDEDIVTAQTAADDAQSDIDGFDDELKSLTTAEVQQLQAIGTTTISATQWGYLGAATQGIWTTTAKGMAYLSVNQLDLSSDTDHVVQFDTIVEDPGGNFDFGLLGSGTATGTTASHLIDAGYDFAAASIRNGMRIKNTTDSTYTYITAVAVGDLTLRDDIFVNGEDWEVQSCRFICPIAGYYFMSAAIRYRDCIVDKYYWTFLSKNGNAFASTDQHSSSVFYVSPMCSGIVKCAAGDFLEADAYIGPSIGVNTVDIQNGIQNTFMHIHFLSEV